MKKLNNPGKEAEENAKSNRQIILRYLLFCGFFLFLVWGVYSFGKDTDFVFDKFLMAAVLLFISVFYEKLHINFYVTALGLVSIILHTAKLYGKTYFGFVEFDMIMHFVASFAICAGIFNYLIKEETSFRHWKKVAVLAIFITAGIGTVIEITEFFGYANLPPGGGILHYGEGDFGGWGDCAVDMIFNFAGSIAASIIIGIIYLKKFRKTQEV